VQFSDGITQIFVEEIPHICSDTAELVHTYIYKMQARTSAI
jgi:hypothetical protein